MVYFLFKKFHIDFLKLIEGSFAGIIYDDISNTVIGFRDHAGTKPLHYYKSKNKIIISSTISGIIEQPDFIKSINNNRVKDYLLHYHSESQESFFKNIHSVSTSAYVEIKDFNIKINKYFSFDTETTIRFSNDLEYAESTRDKFLNIVNSISSNYNDYASKLSGGLDSSSISRVLANNKVDRLKCISVLFEGLSPEELNKVDEKSYIDDVVNMGNIDLNKVIIKTNSTDIISELNDAYKYHNEVVGFYNRTFDKNIFKRLNELNLNVIFDGYDGDSSISFGMEKFLLMVKKLKLIRVILERYRFAKKHNLNFRLQTSLRFILENISKNLGLASTHNNDSNILNKSFFGALHENRQQIINYNNEHEYHADIMNHYAWEYSLSYCDHESNYYRVEEVFPFFNKSLMQYFISIPVDQKLNNGESRYHFRNAMDNILPISVQTRFTKSNLSPMWIRDVNNIDSKFIEKVFFDKRSVINILVNHKYLSNLLYNDKFLPDSGRAQKIYSLVSFYLWTKANNIVL